MGHLGVVPFVHVGIAWLALVPFVHVGIASPASWLFHSNQTVCAVLVQVRSPFRRCRSFRSRESILEGTPDVDGRGRTAGRKRSGDGGGSPSRPAGLALAVTACLALPYATSSASTSSASGTGRTWSVPARFRPFQPRCRDRNSTGSRRTRCRGTSPVSPWTAGTAR